MEVTARLAAVGTIGNGPSATLANETVRIFQSKSRSRACQEAIGRKDAESYISAWGYVSWKVLLAPTLVRLCGRFRRSGS